MATDEVMENYFARFIGHEMMFMVFSSDLNEIFTNLSFIVILAKILANIFVVNLTKILAKILLAKLTKILAKILLLNLANYLAKIPV